MERLGSNHIQLEPEQIQEPSSELSTPRSPAESSIGPTTPTDSFTSVSSKPDALHPLAPHLDFSAKMADLEKEKTAAATDVKKWNNALKAYKGKGRLSKLFSRLRSEKKLGLSDDEVKTWNTSVDTEKTGHTAYLDKQVDLAEAALETSTKTLEQHQMFSKQLKTIAENRPGASEVGLLNQEQDKSTQLTAREMKLGQKLTQLPDKSTHPEVQQDLEKTRNAIESTLGEIRATREVLGLDLTIKLLENKGPYFDEFDKHYEEALKILDAPSSYTGALLKEEKEQIQTKLTSLREKRTQAIENQKAIVEARDAALKSLSSDYVYQSVSQDRDIVNIVDDYESAIKKLLDRKEIVGIDTEVALLTQTMRTGIARALPMAQARSRDGIINKLQNGADLSIHELSAITSGNDKFLAQIGRGLAEVKAKDINFRAEDLLKLLQISEGSGNWHSTNQGFLDHNPQHPANSQDSLLNLPVPGQKEFLIDQNQAKILHAFSEERLRQLQSPEVRMENKSRVIDESKADLLQLQEIELFPRAAPIDFSVERPQKIEIPLLASQISESSEPTATEVTAILLRQAEQRESPETVAIARKLHEQGQVIESSAITQELDSLGEPEPAARLKILQERQEQVRKKLEAVDVVIEQLKDSRQKFEKNLLGNARKLSSALSYATNELEQTRRLVENYDQQISAMSTYLADSYQESYENTKISLEKTTYKGVGKSELFEAEKTRLSKHLKTLKKEVESETIPVVTPVVVPVVTTPEAKKPLRPVKIKIQKGSAPDSAANTPRPVARKKTRIPV